MSGRPSSLHHPARQNEPPAHLSVVLQQGRMKIGSWNDQKVEERVSVESISDILVHADRF